ncbi:glycosyltransferase [Proteus sp. G2669]|uniref:Gt5 n=1 Tax=Proteus penneri TaxID=102862 RepID=A0A385JP16_9GAMM|nr:glycosyltransferase family 2 protein [Proteus sp. G2669]AXZ00049.1 gt5 [Proteus penneri]NBM53724.1 glycosyltransferase [Proteus sp. G2669]
MKNETFSIIMPAYNAEKTIESSIQSVFSQTYSDYILYIVNDCSTDNTKEILSKYNKNNKIVIINNNVNMGVAESRNLAINLCTGHYIAFLDSDDLWEKEKLAQHLKYFNMGWNVVCSNYGTFNENNITNYRKSPEIFSFNDLLKTCHIGNLTGTYNAKKLGKFYQKKIGHEDYLMWLTILKKCDKAYCIQQFLAKYRISNQSLSGNKYHAIKWQWNIYRNELKLPLIKSVYYFFHYIFNAIKKRL